jgi:biopolymer transport protein TolR
MATSMRGRRGRRLKAEINVVPYIDVMLVLLVIFMVASPLFNPGVINLPTAAQSPQAPTEYIQISLQPKTAATIGINGGKHATPVAENMASRDALVMRLRDMHSQYPELPVMISGDKDIKYDEVISMISEAKKLGILRVGLATKQ